jgi:hypothetical protein
MIGKAQAATQAIIAKDLASGIGCTSLFRGVGLATQFADLMPSLRRRDAEKVNHKPDV